MGRGLLFSQRGIKLFINKRGNGMDIKKIFINCMIILCIGVIGLSIFTVVKRSNELKEDPIVSQDMTENDEIIVDTEDTEEVEADVESLEIKTLYTKSKVNVRTGPGTNYTKVIELQAGVEITAVGELDENGWQMIDYEGTEAYILGRYLSDTMPVITPPAPETPTPEQTPTVPEQTPVTPEQTPATPEQTPTTPEQTPVTPEVPAA